MKSRVSVLHGVNFDVLGRRPASRYGGLKLTELEVRVKRFARDWWAYDWGARPDCYGVRLYWNSARSMRYYTGRASTPPSARAAE